MTRKQIGEALEYKDPQKAIDNLHSKHKERLDKFSVTLKVRGTDGKEYDTCLYSAKGVYEICRWSKQPKANEFFDWVYEILEGIRSGKIKIPANLFTPRMALDVAKFVSKELRASQQASQGNKSYPDSMTLNILQEVFAQAGVNIPLDQYRKQAEEARQAEAERIAEAKKSGLQPGTIPKGRPNRVKELREARGWCQSYLAHKAGISRPMISYAERGGKTKNISQRTWEGICKAFEMPVEEVFPVQVVDKQQVNLILIERRDCQ